MPSLALQTWTGPRALRLDALNRQCAGSGAVLPPLPELLDENRRGYSVLLSAHFQGFCRDLHTESDQIIASKTRRSLQLLIQNQFSTDRRLNYGNPTIENIETDFRRFNCHLRVLLLTDPSNIQRLTDLQTLNKWRNFAAHSGNPPSGGTVLNLTNLRRWRSSCDGLAIALDGIMYTELRRILRRSPW